MARESTQHKLSRVRAPRVHITYDVELGGAIEQKELPFVVGVMGDFSGKPAEPLGRLRDRKFIDVDRDNFDSVLAGMKPRLAFAVDNKLENNESRMAVELKFSKLEDFEPDQIAQQIEPMRKLVEARKQLSDLVSKMDGNERLETLLGDVISNTDQQRQLGAALGLEGKKTEDE